MRRIQAWGQHFKDLTMISGTDLPADRLKTASQFGRDRCLQPQRPFLHLSMFLSFRLSKQQTACIPCAPVQFHVPPLGACGPATFAVIRNRFDAVLPQEWVTKFTKAVEEKPWWEMEKCRSVKCFTGYFCLDSLNHIWSLKTCNTSSKTWICQHVNQTIKDPLCTLPSPDTEIPRSRWVLNVAHRDQGRWQGQRLQD